MYPLTVGANVSELQEPTYSPVEEWLEAATSTQPDSDESYLVEVKPLTIEEEILKVFPDAPIMVEVARCESELDPTADRVTSDGRTGIDVGLFQINQVHLKKLNELGLDRYDLHDNLTFARMLYDRAGLRDWYMSAHCWSKYL